MSLRFKQVDVFTGKPFAGNPVAVILDADELDGETMQRIANWTNLSETTFVLKPTQANADYRVRIFTPRSELPFAGHPTLGTAHAVLDAGIAAPRDGRLVQECSIGLVNLSLSGAGRERVVTLELPPATVRELASADIDDLSSVLGAPVERAPAPRIIDVGPRWIVTRLHDAASVAGLRPDMARMAALSTRLEATGVTVFGLYPPGGPAAIEVRAFAPADGVNEDPVCGSGNGCVAVFARDGGLLEALGRRYVASQGGQVGRAGRVQVEIDGHGIVRLGGQCVTCVDGMLAT
ncbi:MAG TPA: PhzF family phenazine biosynthesis protein [Vineibacter sp.]|nr:PhzF family phenazine biosynthesis protein [Vineibacter sp.]